MNHTRIGELTMKKHILTFLIFICFAAVLIISLSKENKIKEYETEKIELAIYINDEETNIIPSKDSGYYYDREKSSCTNGISIGTVFHRVLWYEI